MGADSFLGDIFVLRPLLAHRLHHAVLFVDKVAGCCAGDGSDERCLARLGRETERFQNSCCTDCTDTVFADMCVSGKRVALFA